MERTRNQAETTNKATPNSQVIKRRIGNTFYTVNIHFSGTETAEDKMFRIIKIALAKNA